MLERSQKYFQVDIGGQAEVVSADRLKPHLDSSAKAPALPPKRGCPGGAVQRLDLVPLQRLAWWEAVLLQRYLGGATASGGSMEAGGQE
jgi:hypothetical protein